MTQTAPVLPNYETAVLEPNIESQSEQDPQSEQPIGGRFNPPFYLFLSQQLKAVQQITQAALAGTSKAGAITLNVVSGIITTEPLTTPGAGVYALTLTDNQIEANSNVLVTVSNGTNTAGVAILQDVVISPLGGSAVIKILNVINVAFNGSLQLNFIVR